MLTNNSAKFEGILQCKRPAPAPPRVAPGASYSHELCAPGIQTTDLCRVERRVCTVLQGFSCSSRALKHKDTSPYGPHRPNSYDANETAENPSTTLPFTHGSSPREAPHAHFQEEIRSSQCLSSPHSPVQGVKHH